MSSLDRIIEHLEGLAEQIDITLSAARALKGQDEVPSPPTTGPDKDDWIEVGMAANRFGIAKDTIRFWCRREPYGEFGTRRGGRWLVSVSALRAKLSKA